MVWFVVGALVGAIFGVASLVRLQLKHPGSINYPIQQFVFAVVMGTVIVGLPLWLLSLIF
jgi:hypothetical protein